MFTKCKCTTTTAHNTLAVGLQLLNCDLTLPINVWLKPLLKSRRFLALLQSSIRSDFFVILHCGATDVYGSDSLDDRYDLALNVTRLTIGMDTVNNKGQRIVKAKRSEIRARFSFADTRSGDEDVQYCPRSRPISEIASYLYATAFCGGGCSNYSIQYSTISQANQLSNCVLWPNITARTLCACSVPPTRTHICILIIRKVNLDFFLHPLDALRSASLPSCGVCLSVCPSVTRRHYV